MRMFYLMAMLTVAAPGFAAPSAPPAPVQDVQKAAPDTRSRIYDSNRKPAPPKPSPKAGPEIG